MVHHSTTLPGPAVRAIFNSHAYLNIRYLKIRYVVYRYVCVCVSVCGCLLRALWRMQPECLRRADQ